MDTSFVLNDNSPTPTVDFKKLNRARKSSKFKNSNKMLSEEISIVSKKESRYEGTGSPVTSNIESKGDVMLSPFRKSEQNLKRK